MKILKINHFFYIKTNKGIPYSEFTKNFRILLSLIFIYEKISKISKLPPPNLPIRDILRYYSMNL